MSRWRLDEVCLWRLLLHLGVLKTTTDWDGCINLSQYEPTFMICKSLKVWVASNEHRHSKPLNLKRSTCRSVPGIVSNPQLLQALDAKAFWKLRETITSGSGKVVRGIPWLNSKNCQEYKKTRKRLKDLQIFTYLHITSYYIIAINWKKIGLLKTCQCNESEWKDPHENLIEFVHMQSPAFPRNI